MKYESIERCDKELYQFCLRQKTYFAMIPQTIRYKSIQDDMQGPKGFDEKQYDHDKIFDQDQMVAYLDYIQGYRFSMIKDPSCVWIGFILVDESQWRNQYDRHIIENLLETYADHTIQLGCLLKNKNGTVFWKAMGFQEIASSYCSRDEVLIFEKTRIAKHDQ